MPALRSKGALLGRILPLWAALSASAHSLIYCSIFVFYLQQKRAAAPKKSAAANF